MKKDKINQLDDSVRFLGKEIDPYSNLHKRNANFFREVLLESVGIKPENREQQLKNIELASKRELK